ncbi:hypothetical protein ACWGB8_31740 [Kitasatospora sp. NPDC054939]
MTGFLGMNAEHNFVLLIRDADTIAAALGRALAEATPKERPGLERAASLVAATAAATETRLRADWARSRLAAVGFTGKLDSVDAVKALRRAEPKLSLAAAVQLQRDAVAQPE